jgi:hypothetical protein
VSVDVRAHQRRRPGAPPSEPFSFKQALRDAILSGGMVGAIDAADERARSAVDDEAFRAAVADGMTARRELLHALVLTKARDPSDLAARVDAWAARCDAGVLDDLLAVLRATTTSGGGPT